ncbi:beta-ketoacyl-[acyl-carrier-protein] synthase family protein [Amycolatopsis magusensis]|uniref:3-oxoacyl-[acyl-carrier-protein] synthase II n=1 Tax=Amycolatopsis magusensis TaxID=882444 RepID=A0ABS4PZM9_9PSEU|nr:beta-ketoacyl-[acyl-carrier-protein] synthase family protein [Amycolatopsis magusensis]MBP2184889.1 3-oxoacyl-[acyl-carrier-protein] synthase II [Amycolatopsis magusensis]MDI5976704.1 beta-ketoacyl-[acyl-carrier-protein] synthase family protein [Amycolatopsis magusensis]
MPSQPADPGRRVVITGLGVVSSIGTGVAEFSAALRAGRSNVRPISVFDTTGFEHVNGCEVTDFEPERWIRQIDFEELGRASRFSTAAARLALTDSGLSQEALAEARCLISVGSTDGESHELDQLVSMELHGGPESMSPRLARRISAGRLATSIARELELSNVETSTIVTACSAGNYAIGNSFDAIRFGDADYALCGGADAVCRKTFTSFYRLRSIAPDCCRPFDRNRMGILTGEGAGILLLESLESATARGARIYAEVLGYGLSCDAHHPVAPHQGGIARCMELALANAGVKPGEVDLISAHGTGTKANDLTETAAIRDTFGERPPRVVSMKSMLGHTMGAASALAAIGCSVAITDRFIPPTINHVETDPECAIDCVPNTSVEADLRIVQNNGWAFGGNNSVVLFGRYDGQAVGV